MSNQLDPAKKNSIVLTEGPNRAAARSYFRSVGFSKEDLHKPIIGIANTWTEVGPCNFHLRQVAEAVKQGVREAGGTPMEFNTITVHDGITMGTQGMKASLISREVIADSIELVTRANSFDGLVCIAGCDKNMPAAIMALGRLDIPGLMLYGGSIAPGKLPQPDGSVKEITVLQVFEAIGSHAAGKITDDELEAVEAAACPGPGACGGQFTANTMAMAGEFLGISPIEITGVPAMSPEKARASREAGRLVMDLARKDLRPSKIVTRKTIEDAYAAACASGARPMSYFTFLLSRANSTSRLPSTTSTRSVTEPRTSATSLRAASTPRKTIRMLVARGCSQNDSSMQDSSTAARSLLPARLSPKRRQTPSRRPISLSSIPSTNLSSQPAV